MKQNCYLRRENAVQWSKFAVEAKKEPINEAELLSVKQEKNLVVWKACFVTGKPYGLLK